MPTDNQVARQVGRRQKRFFFLKRESNEDAFRRRERTNLEQRRKLEKLEPTSTIVGKHGEIVQRRVEHERRDKKGQ